MVNFITMSNFWTHPLQSTSQSLNIEQNLKTPNFYKNLIMGNSEVFLGDLMDGKENHNVNRKLFSIPAIFHMGKWTAQFTTDRS